jgi:hypothetical protein
VPALVYLALLFLLDVAQTVLFVQEKLAAAGALDHTMLVLVLRMLYKLVVFLESGLAFLARMPSKEAHKMSRTKYSKKMTEKERVATPLFTCCASC